MVSRGDNSIVIYPVYFDSGVTRLNGRRVGKKLAVEKPSIETIAKAAKSLGLATRIEKNAMYSSTPWKKEGRILIQKKGSKSKLLFQLASRL